MKETAAPHVTGASSSRKGFATTHGHKTVVETVGEVIPSRSNADSEIVQVEGITRISI